MKTSITGIIKDVKLIELAEPTLQYIYGTVECDNLGRWQPGDWMLSSAITRIDSENMLVHTRNRLYKIDALQAPILLNAKQFLLVRQGVSPSNFQEHS